MIRPRRGGYQVIVYAGIDPVTGHQRQIARQVKGKREAERLEARLRAEVADGRHRPHRRGAAGRLPRPAGDQRQASLPRHPQRLPHHRRDQAQAGPRQAAAPPARPGHPGPLLRPAAPPGSQRLGRAQYQPGPAGPCRAVRRAGPGRPLWVDRLQPGAAGQAAGRRPPRTISVRFRPRPRSARPWPPPSRRTRPSACSCGCAPPSGFGPARCARCAGATWTWRPASCRCRGMSYASAGWSMATYARDPRASTVSPPSRAHRQPIDPARGHPGAPDDTTRRSCRFGEGSGAGHPSPRRTGQQARPGACGAVGAPLPRGQARWPSASIALDRTPARRRPPSVAGEGRAEGASCFAGKLRSPARPPGDGPHPARLRGLDPYASPYAGHPRPLVDRERRSPW